MGRRGLLVALGIVLAIGVAVLSYVRLGGGPEAIGPQGRTAGSDAASAPDLDASGPAQRSAAAEAGRALEEPGKEPGREAGAEEDGPFWSYGRAMLRGRVLDGAGAPIAGARVSAVPSAETSFNTLDAELMEPPSFDSDGGTDSEGRFSLEVEDWVVLTVEVSAEGFGAHEREGCFPGAALEIVLERACSLEGVVTREDDGSPVAGALVRAFPVATERERETRTDASGGYVLEDLAAGEALVQVIPLELATPPGQSVTLEAWRRTTLDVRVKAGWVLTGQVRDARTGAGIAGAEVSSWSFHQKTVRTDAGGFYRLPGVQARRGTLDARAAGYGRLEVAFDAADEPLDIELVPGLTVRGRLLDEQGFPVAYARVSACGFTQERGLGSREWKSALTYAHGRFVIPDVRRDLDLYLFARATGHASLRHPIGPVGQGVIGPVGHGVPEVNVGDLVLARGARVEGSVLTAAGRPLARVLVELRGPRAEKVPDRLASYLSLRQTRTDSRGVFRVADLAAGHYAVRLVRPDKAVQGGVRSASGPVPLTLDLEPGQLLEGVVWRFPGGGRLSGIVRGPDGAPLVGAPVSLLLEGGDGDLPNTRIYPLHTRTDERGEFAFKDAAPVLYTVRASAVKPGERMGPLAPAVVQGVEPDGRYMELDLQRLDAWIAGVVVDEQDAAVPQVLVSVDHGDGFRRDGVLTGDAGRFRVRVPSSGAWTLRAWRTTELEVDGNMTTLEWELQRSILRPKDPVRLPDVAPGTADAVLRLPR